VTVDTLHLLECYAREGSEYKRNRYHHFANNLECAIAQKIKRLAHGAVDQVLNR